LALIGREQLDQLQEDLVAALLDVEDTGVLVVDQDDLKPLAREPFVEDPPLELLVPAPERLDGLSHRRAVEAKEELPIGLRRRP
jgi:hypothetical protein